MMARKPTPPYEFTYTDMRKQDAEGYTRGFREGYAKAEQEAVANLKAQREQLNIEQTRVVTDLMRAAGENLSKAGYLIGKLNKDNAR